MRVHRESETDRFPRRLLAAATLPASLSFVLAAALLACPSAQAAAPATAAGPSAAKASAAGRVVAKPVAPQVRSLAMPALSTARKATPRSLSAYSASGAEHLVAYVTRPVVSPFSMVAVTWGGARISTGLSVRLRTRYHGAWTGWTKLAADGDGPSAAEDTHVRYGTTPYWVGRATGVEAAVYASGSQRPAHLAVDTIDPGRSAYDARIQSTVSAEAAKSSGVDGKFPRMPHIVTRAEWGADESLGDTCWSPKYGTRFDAVIVHHTAGSNDYTKAQAASVVRGILAYHTISRGWCDIGYNFLIDRYGTVYEGRAGGIRQPVRGAHAGNYNLNTTGISLMGNFDIASPTRTMEHSLVQLIAWRLGTAYHGAYGHPYLYDGRFDRISGHRDVMQTACPGRYVYAWLPTLRKRVERRLGGYESPIEVAWKAAGGAHSRLGPVRIGERSQRGGHNTRFEGGRMYDSSYGLYTFYSGPVLHYYVHSGAVNGDLGYPRSDLSTTGAGGRMAKFAGGRIYWSKASNAHSLRHGAILRQYLRVGAAGGELGFPTSSVHAVTGGMRAGFQHGHIMYDAATQKTTVTIR
jgi:hypothetical protein